MENATCPICDSEETQALGGLGNRLHFRCRACGMDFSHDMTADERAEYDAAIEREADERADAEALRADRLLDNDPGEIW